MAVAYGRRVRDVLGDPYAETLWMFFQLAEHERIEAVKERAKDLYRASLVSFATWDPKKLGEERERLLGDAGYEPPDPWERAQPIVDAMRLIDAQDAARGLN